MSGVDSAESKRIWTLPNIISMSRLALVPVFAYLIVQEAYGWAIAILAFSGVSDWLDGYLARKLNQITKLGQMLDPAADRLYILVTLIGLAWRDFIPWWFMIVIVSRDVVLALLYPLLVRYGYGPLPVHFVGKAGTFALLYALPLILLGGVSSSWSMVASVLGWAFAWWALGLYWLGGLLYIGQTLQIVRREKNTYESQTH